MAYIRSVCVYCGASFGASPDHERLAKATGARIAEGGLTLVYGGGSVGLMGVTAQAALDAGGQVIGVIPSFLHQREVIMEGLTELHVVKDMHSRKKMMFERSDAFLVLPGGLGTLDEFFEIVTWKQLGIHDCPIVLLNHQGFFQPLLGAITHTIDTGFARESTAGFFSVADTLDDAMDKLARAEAPERAAAGLV